MALHDYPALSCPQCKKPVTWSEEFPYRPFCSERCKLIDLGEWADESYKIPVKGDIVSDLDEFL